MLVDVTFKGAHLSDFGCRTHSNYTYSTVYKHIHIYSIQNICILLHSGISMLAELHLQWLPENLQKPGVQQAVCCASAEQPSSRIAPGWA